ncbi:MAG: arginine--tRNA ligase [Propionibacteriaceae bacterium]|jgi:arginyl-tRNA synthetase|nr:arginine--tRNA ligase [Propionibacteriaceae bacterium]
MAPLLATLNDRIQAVTGIDPELRPATKPQFGHFQTNAALRRGAEQGRNPRAVAAELTAALDLSDICEPLEIAGPGFINIRVRADVLARVVTANLLDPHSGIEQAGQPQAVVVDYSSPNVAKQMHVGHLRSTIIGDCFTRVLAIQGHHVIRQNHIGDWGRQFGMLIEQIRDEQLDLDTLDLADSEALYLRANAHLTADPEFADRARARVVALQGGEPETLAIWQRLIEISAAGFAATYSRLGVLLTRDDIAGESSYNAMLAGICTDLEARGIATMDNGALVVFVPGFDAPAILRNSAGGYGYDVTDVAAIRHRLDDFHADRLVYVTDARQQDHFLKVFAVARQAGYLPDTVAAEHVGFGMVLGADGTPFKTREGTAVHLDDLLDEAEATATPEVALAAIKYADLSNQLHKDYVFDPARMTKTTGDTGPYLQYAHARVSSILRLAVAEGEQLDDAHSVVTTLDKPEEQALALALVRFPEVVAEVGETLQPHKLCGYLYDLASQFSGFYEHCPVLKAAGETRHSRCVLGRATARVLSTGLGLLGIAAPETM